MSEAYSILHGFEKLSVSMSQYVAKLRLRNLPWGAGPREIRSFLGVAPDQKVEIVQYKGRPSGHALVHLSDQQDALNIREQKDRQIFTHGGRHYRIDVLTDFTAPKVKMEELTPGDVRAPNLVLELRYLLAKDAGQGPWRVDLLAPKDTAPG